MSKIEVNAIEPQCGTTLTLGASGDTVSIASGANLSGVGTVSWDTTAKTASFTAVSGNGYFVNTTSGAVTMTLPASPSSGDIVAVADYANTFATNNLTVARNSSLINGGAFDYKSSTNGISLTFVYVDGTRGWKNVNDGTTNATGQSDFIIATGGTVTCCGDYKIHTFTGPGTFTVTSAGTPAGSNTVDYLVIAGGGGTGGLACQTGGGGAGGFRLSNSTCMPAPTTSPLASPTGLPVSATSYPITVGAGGAPVPVPSPAGGNPGSNSIFSTITSAGGGAGSGGPTTPAINSGQAGGSGGGSRGGGGLAAGAAGNTPPVSPPQGNPGGPGCHSSPLYGSGGGGGAGAAGTLGNSSNTGNGGAGSYVVSAGFAGCNGTTGPVCGARYFAGGGGGSSETAGGSGGTGGGGAGAVGNPGTAVGGTTNTGGGAGSGNDANGAGAAGGSGIVIIRYKYQ